MALETITISDPHSGSIADVLPGFGMNCFRFQVRLDGQPFDVLWAVDGFASGDERPSGSGIPHTAPVF